MFLPKQDEDDTGSGQKDKAAGEPVRQAVAGKVHQPAAQDVADDAGQPGLDDVKDALALKGFPAFYV